MKLSVLIPAYNYDCTDYVRLLLSQLDEEDEIIVGDDHSEDEGTRNAYDTIGRWPQCRVWTSEENIGRARMRNQLASMAKGDWLLFTDCDAQVASPTFIAYYKHESEGREMVCGGTGNLNKCPSASVRLRWLYEVNTEHRLTLEYRRKHPYDCLTTFNFMIRKTLFDSIHFDEHCLTYGHEDTAFGAELKRRGIPVHHIDNKLIHLGLDTNEEYLKKTETALHSLVGMSEDVRRHARVSRLQIDLHRWGGDKLIGWLFACCGKTLKKNLLSDRPSLRVYALYKLGYFCRLAGTK